MKSDEFCFIFLQELNFYIMQFYIIQRKCSSLDIMKTRPVLKGGGLINGLFQPFCYFFCIAGHPQTMPFLNICALFMGYAFLMSVILNVFSFKFQLYHLLFWNNHQNNQERSKTELLNFSKNLGIKYPLSSLTSTVFMKAIALITEKTN